MTPFSLALKNPKPYLKAIRNSFIADIEYRSSYYLLIFSSFVSVFMELAIFEHIFSKQEIAGDLHKNDALSFIVLGLLIRNGATLWSMIADWIEQIREGSFRKYLLQPLHMPSFFFAQAIGPKLTTWTLSLITIVVCKMNPLFSNLLPLERVPGFIVALALAYFLTWQIYLSIIYLAFWIEEASFLSTAFNLGMGLFTGTLIPLSWFPTWFAKLIGFTPFPLIGNFPLRWGISTMSLDDFYTQLLALLAWTGGFLVFNRLLQSRAFKRFEAYGG